MSENDKAVHSALTTPDQIKVYQWMTIRTMMRMEKLGMRHSSGPIRPRWAKELKLKPKDSYDKFIAALTKLIEGEAP